jgi:hypothetical protein
LRKQRERAGAAPGWADCSDRWQFFGWLIDLQFVQQQSGRCPKPEPGIGERSRAT